MVLPLFPFAESEGHRYAHMEKSIPFFVYFHIIYSFSFLQQIGRCSCAFSDEHRNQHSRYSQNKID